MTKSLLLILSITVLAGCNIAAEKKSEVKQKSEDTQEKQEKNSDGVDELGFAISEPPPLPPQNG